MLRVAFLLLPSILLAASPRYARMGDFQGKVEVQLTAAHRWIPAARNLPLMEATWLRTAEASRAEIELDEGNALRIGPESQVELSDYKRLSTGQRITLLTVDRGVAWFTGIAEGSDALLVAVPGAQATITRGSRVRLEVQERSSRIAVIEGVVRFSSPAAEFDLREGQTAQVDPSNPARFVLDKQFEAHALDTWSEERDKALVSSTSASHVAHRYGVVDLDAAGEWIQTEDLGAVWKPKTAEGWRPFEKGRWHWYDALGYTWVSDEPWGWLPYHYGRWQRKENLGWIWAPSQSGVFKPGEVYWLRGTGVAGWGPLGPDESWPAPEKHQPRQFLQAHTVWSAFRQDAALLDPTGFEPPKEPLSAAAFVVALPSPAFPASKLDPQRPLVRAGRGRVNPIVDGITFSGGLPQPPPPEPVVIIAEAPAPPPPPPPDIIYAPQVVLPPTILIVNPVGNPDYGRRQRRQQSPQNQSQNPTPTATTPPVTAPPVTSLPPTPSRTASPLPKVQLPDPGAPPQRPPSTANREPAQTPRLPRAEGPTAPQERAPSGRTPQEKKFRDAGETKLLNEVMKQVAAPNYNQALIALDEWSTRYRASAFSDDRNYYYLQTYSGLNQPAKAIEKSFPLVVGSDLAASFRDPMQIVSVLYLASLNFQKLEHPTPEQRIVGRKAAEDLLSYLPVNFAPENRPENVTPENWTRVRNELEILAKQTVARTARR